MRLRCYLLAKGHAAFLTRTFQCDIQTWPHVRVGTSACRAFSVSTSLQQQLDVPRVVHREPVAAGQGVEQRGFSFKSEFTQ